MRKKGKRATRRRIPKESLLLVVADCDDEGSNARNSDSP